MKQILVKSILSIMFAAAIAGFTSCSSAPNVEKSSTSSFEEGVPGGVLVETYETDVTVTRIDPNIRTVTLLAPDGTYNTFAAGLQDTTFNKLRVGDKVKASVARELVVFLARNGPPKTDIPDAASELASKSGAADVLVGKPFQRNATIGSVDAERRLVTLKFADGTSKTFPLRKDVKATGLKSGDAVVIQTGSAVTLEVAKQ